MIIHGLPEKEALFLCPKVFIFMHICYKIINYDKTGIQGIC